MVTKLLVKLGAAGLHQVFAIAFAARQPRQSEAMMANPQKKSSRAQLLCTVHESARPTNYNHRRSAGGVEEAMVGVEAMAAVRMAVWGGGRRQVTMVDIGRGGGGDVLAVTLQNDAY